MKREHLQRLALTPAKCGGRPRIRGLRIRVTDILETLAAGSPFDEILRISILSARISAPP